MTLTSKLAGCRGFRRAMLVINSVLMVAGALGVVLSALAGAWLPVAAWALVACGNAWAVESGREALRDIRRNLARRT